MRMRTRMRGRGGRCARARRSGARRWVARHRGASRLQARRPPVRGRCVPTPPRTPATLPARAASWSGEPGRSRPGPRPTARPSRRRPRARAAPRSGRRPERSAVRSGTSTARGRGRGRPGPAGSDACRRDHRHPRPAAGRIYPSGLAPYRTETGGPLPRRSAGTSPPGLPRQARAAWARRGLPRIPALLGFFPLSRRHIRVFHEGLARHFLRTAH